MNGASSHGLHVELSAVGTTICLLVVWFQVQCSTNATNYMIYLCFFDATIASGSPQLHPNQPYQLHVHQKHGVSVFRERILLGYCSVLALWLQY